MMSLRILNENSRQGRAYLSNVLRTIGPSRVFTAAAVHLGEAILPELYTAFGTVWFDRWRHPDPANLDAAVRTALTTVGLPGFFADLADSDAYDQALRDSHHQGIADLGRDVGTPILHINTVPWFGPVLNATPRGQQALDLYDSILVLAERTDFIEFKRSRSSPPKLERCPSDTSGTS